MIGRKEKRKKNRDKGERQNDRRKREADEKAGEEERGRKEERREIKERRRRKKNRESSAKDAPPSSDAFPSTKLRSNMTLIKGKLGKNTTPTCRRTAALIPNSHKDPQQRQPDFDDSSYPDSGYSASAPGATLLTLTSSSTLDRSRYLRSHISLGYIATQLHRHSATLPLGLSARSHAAYLNEFVYS